jgi:ribonuclease HI
MMVIYTDGACSGNPGPGGWAWAASPEGTPCDSGSEVHTTNQRMEIMAVLEALRSTTGEVTIVSDSTYVVNCFRDRWWVRWQANGWRNSKKEPVANADLWKPLIELVQQRSPQFRWVKGHSGDRMNDLVDRLAVAASQAVNNPPATATQSATTPPRAAQSATQSATNPSTTPPPAATTPPGADSTPTQPSLF